MKTGRRVLGLITVMAVSALGIGNAAAVTTGHVTSEVTWEHHVMLTGTQEYQLFKEGNFSFQQTAGGIPVGETTMCTHVAYHGTLSGAASTTSQALSLKPQYKNCKTTSAETYTTTFSTPAACGTEVLQFTSGNPGTVHIQCTITVTHPNCVITIPRQKLSSVSYSTTTVNSKHALSLKLNAEKVTGHFHEKACVSLGTTQEFHMKHSFTLWGEHLDQTPRGITQT